MLTILPMAPTPTNRMTSNHTPDRSRKLLLSWMVVSSSLLLLLVPCHAFAHAVRPDVLASLSKRRASTSSLVLPQLYKLRGGAESGSYLSVGLSDYSDAARSLFGNIIGPASMVTGGLVPLGFLADPLPGQKKFHKRLRSIYLLLSIVSLANELIAIMYATVASNKLIETTVAPAASVFALLQRDCELSWIATNVHFMAGLFGFLGMVCLRAYALLPPNINKAGAGIATAFLLGMCSVVNRGIQQGNRAGRVFGTSILGLAYKYAELLLRQVYEQPGPMVIAAIALAIGSTFLAVKSILQYTDE